MQFLLLTRYAHLTALHVTGFVQISMPKFVCGNYGICTYTRGPHSLDWNTAVELKGARAKARASESICETSKSQRHWCLRQSCLRCFIIRLEFLSHCIRIWTLQEHLGPLSAPAPHPCSQTVLSVIQPATAHTVGHIMPLTLQGGVREKTRLVVPVFNGKNGNAPILGSPAQRSMARVTRREGECRRRGTKNCHISDFDMLRCKTLSQMTSECWILRLASVCPHDIPMQ